MAKVKGKRIRQNFFKKSTNNISTEVVNHLPFVNSNETATLETGELSGYIFMCNGNTKPECYVNRVFGLPAGRREVVEKIKPGTKLFLFDFDVKLLYVVYEAVSAGGMNLQPTAFGGRFPAQVQFKIWKDCLPLPLNSFRTAIKDIFQGSKFAQELNDQQVRDLVLLFKPIVAPSPATLHLPVPSATPVPLMPPAAINVRLSPSSNPPLQMRYQPYITRTLHNHSQQMNWPQFVHKDGLNPYPYHHRPSATYQPPRAHVNTHQFAENQSPYFANEHPKNLQEAYPRHLTIPAVYPHDPTVVFNGGHNGLAIPTVTNHIDRSHGHNPYTAPTSLYGSTSSPYSGPAYMHSRPSMPVSSYYSFVGGTQIER